MPLETKRALIVVRTYPTPAKQGIEVSCTAAITDTGEWLRLFPVPYRFLDSDKRFRKYQWVDVQVSKAADHRVESYKIENNSITIVTDHLPTEHGWRERRKLVGPLVKPSLCWLQRERDRQQYPTLGIFKPRRIMRLVIESEAEPDWSESELQILRRRTPAGSLISVFSSILRFFDVKPWVRHSVTVKVIDSEPKPKADVDAPRRHGCRWLTKER
jgi:hypothetical protein